MAQLQQCLTQTEPCKGMLRIPEQHTPVEINSILSYLDICLPMCPNSNFQFISPQCCVTSPNVDRGSYLPGFALIGTDLEHAFTGTQGIIFSHAALPRSCVCQQGGYQTGFGHSRTQLVGLFQLIYCFTGPAQFLQHPGQGQPSLKVLGILI